MSVDSSVRLAEIVSADNIIPSIKARDKEGVIRELVAALAATGRLDHCDVDSVAQAVIEREKLGSTGIGNGIAVPHAKLPGIEEPVGILGRAVGGMDFESLDGAATHTIFLFLSPADHPNKHVALMSRFVTLMRKGDFVSFLRQTEGRDALHEFLGEVDAW